MSMMTLTAALVAVLVAAVCGAATNGAGPVPPAGYVRSAESAKACGDTYGLPSRYLTGPLVAYYHASGLKLATWTSDSEADNETVWAKLAGWGIDSITTYHPARLLAWEAKNCKK